MEIIPNASRLPNNFPNSKSSAKSWRSIFKIVTTPFPANSKDKRVSFFQSHDLQKKFISNFQNNRNANFTSQEKEEKAVEENIHPIPSLHEVSKRVITVLCSGEPLSSKKVKLAKEFMRMKPTLMKRKTEDNKKFLNKVYQQFFDGNNERRSSAQLESNFKLIQRASESYSVLSDKSSDESMIESDFSGKEEEQRFLDISRKFQIPKMHSHDIKHIGIFTKKKGSRSISVTEVSPPLISPFHKSMVTPKNHAKANIGLPSIIDRQLTTNIDKNYAEIFDSKTSLAELHHFSSQVHLYHPRDKAFFNIVNIRRKSCCCSLCGKLCEKALKFQNLGIENQNKIRKPDKQTSIVISPIRKKTHNFDKPNTPRANLFKVSVNSNKLLMPDYRKNNSLLNSLQKISKTSTDINNQATLSGNSKMPVISHQRVASNDNPYLLTSHNPSLEIQNARSKSFINIKEFSISEHLPRKKASIKLDYPNTARNLKESEKQEAIKFVQKYSEKGKTLFSVSKHLNSSSFSNIKKAYYHKKTRSQI